jgi:3D-(3,5/4)-trihydroxycyclohexane-1,2-dione acylhydrolase (decyclizing)
VTTVRLTAAQALVRFLAAQYVERDGIERLIRAGSVEELRAGLAAARDEGRTPVISIEVDRYEGVPSYESWWDVAIAEVSEVAAVRSAREKYEAARERERSHL